MGKLVIPDKDSGQTIVGEIVILYLVGKRIFYRGLYELNDYWFIRLYKDTTDYVGRNDFKDKK